MDISIHGVNRSAAYQLSEIGDFDIALMADRGEVGIGSLPVPSTDMSQEADAGQRALLVSSGTTILDGFIGELQRDRNGVVGGRQVFHYNLLDQNALLGGHVARKWVRPAETDVQRMTAAAAAFLGHLSLDYTWLLATNAQNLPAKTYMTEAIFDELQTDCGDPTAKTLYIENGRFHWHLQSEGISAGLSIVAHSAEADNVTTFHLLDNPAPSRSKDAMDLAIDITVTNDAGAVYHTVDSAAQTLHDADGMRHERLIEAGSATLAEMTTMGDRVLATYKAQRATYAGTIGPLTAAQVAMIPPGSLISATNSVWGVASVQRIASIHLSYLGMDRWLAHLELGYAARLRVRPLKDTSKSSVGTGEQSNGDVNHCGCNPFVCGTPDLVVHGTGNAANHPMSCVVTRAGDSCDSGNVLDVAIIETVTLYIGATYRVDYFVTRVAESEALTASLHTQAGGGGYYGSLYMGTNATGGPHDDINGGSVTFTADQTQSDFAAHLSGDAMFMRTAYGCTIYATVNYVSGPDPRFVGLLGERCANGDPKLGQHTVEDITTAGGATTYATNYPYAPNGIHITTDGGATIVPIQTDPATGSFTLPVGLPDGTVLHITYQVADPTYLGTGNTNTITSGTGHMPYPLLGSGGDGSGGHFLTDAGTWVGGNFLTKKNGGGDTIMPHGSMGSAETFDPADGNVHTGTLTADCTVSLTNPTGSDACTLELRLAQDGTGGWHITWPGSVTVVGTLDTTLGTTSIVIVESLDGGTSWVAVVVGGGGSGVTYGTPAIVLGTAAAAGSTDEAIRRDATIVAFDATVPTTQALGDSAATGAAAVAARRDHKHAMPALSSATPLVESGAGAVGTALPSSREDHVHPAVGSTGPYYAPVMDGSGNVVTDSGTGAAIMTLVYL